MISKFKKIAYFFDEKSSDLKQRYLDRLSTEKIRLNKSLIQYFNLLLFICAYPDNKTIRILAEKELIRISAFLKKHQHKIPELFTNSGLPFTYSNSAYTHDTVRWLLAGTNYKIKYHSYEDAKLEMNDVLTYTLPNLERVETTRGLENDELLESLMVKEKNKLPFIISELSKFNDTPYVKDYFYDGLGICVDIIPKNKKFSKAYNRIAVNKIFYHQEILKRFDHQQLLKKAIPAASSLTKKAKENLILTIKHSLLLLNRETDPVTYMDENSLRLYELDRGISIAIYGMIPERQLPIESYVGYTLFKNGFPAAYGGSWVFGKHADFGINIFETYRGGESGYIMCSLLRLYSQVFDVNYFEVEPYQFGLGNPEGISSGAYWFYYRYGFRSLEKEQLKISKIEQTKIVKRKGYKSSKKTLEKLAQSPVGLKLGNKTAGKAGQVSEMVTKMIARNYNGIRTDAVADSVKKFKVKTKLKLKLNDHEFKVLEDVALWAQAKNIRDKKRLNLFVKMIKVKPQSLYSYQKLLLAFLSN